MLLNARNMLFSHFRGFFCTNAKSSIYQFSAKNDISNASRFAPVGLSILNHSVSDFMLVGPYILYEIHLFELCVEKN